MNDDVRKMIYGVLVLFLLTVVGYISFIYISACGFTLTCPQGKPLVVRTPIPTLIPATMPVPERNQELTAFNKCQVAAVDLIGAWVAAGYPENDTFPFSDVKGMPCEGTFKKDVQPLFLESSLWYPGALACASCHQADLKLAVKNMDLSSYQGIVAGADRANGEPKGTDILGGGDWGKSLLYARLYAPNGQTQTGIPAMPLGRPADVPENGPLVFAGQPVAGGADATPAGTLPPIGAAVTPTGTIAP